MRMKAVPIFISSLADKRERFIAERDHHQARADKAADAIAKIDATLALFEEGKWVRSERRSYRENPGPFAWRELPRLIVSILRDSPEPLTTSDVLARVCAAKGIARPDTAKERTQLSRRVTGAINDKRRHGVIVSDGMLVGTVCPHREREYAERKVRRAQERLERHGFTDAL
jgi:hypothetical protein